MDAYSYPVTLAPEEDGTFVVRFEDFPEAITQGDDIEDALAQAADCLEEAVANRMAMGLSIPIPSGKGSGNHTVTVSMAKLGKVSPSDLKGVSAAR